MRYIDADALIDDLTERYCKECNKRKGIKNGKYLFIYEIGEAPCRACEVDDVKAELEEAPTADVPDINDGDSVNKKSAVDAATKAVMKWDGLYIQSLNMAIKNAIEKIQPAGSVNYGSTKSAQPERKTGRWIVRYECPNCGEGRSYAFDTCPMCGEKMEDPGKKS